MIPYFTILYGKSKQIRRRMGARGVLHCIYFVGTAQYVHPRGAFFDS